MKWRDYLRDFEWHLLLISIVLTSLGIAFIWSSAQASEVLSRKPVHQTLFLFTALPLAGGVIFFNNVPPRILYKISRISQS